MWVNPAPLVTEWSHRASENAFTDLEINDQYVSFFASDFAGPFGTNIGEISMSTMYIGEALVGEGNEIAHIDLIIGSKDGPAGTAFANALARQSEGHSNLLAVLEPNLVVKPATVIVTKVTIKGAKQAVQMFGPAQFAVAKAVADSVGEGIIPKDRAEDLVIICGVFIHWEAEDNKKIYDYNYEATKQALATAMQSKPTVDDMLARKDSAEHPFKGF